MLILSFSFDCDCLRALAGDSNAVEEAIARFRELMRLVKQKLLTFREPLQVRWMASEHVRAIHFLHIEETTKCTLFLLANALPKPREHKSSALPTPAPGPARKLHGPEPMDEEDVDEDGDDDDNDNANEARGFAFRSPDARLAAAVASGAPAAPAIANEAIVTHYTCGVHLIVHKCTVLL